MGDHTNTISNTGVFLGAMSIEKVLGGTAGKVGGIIVQPAVWVATGTTPDAVDVGLFGIGLLGPFAAVAAGVTGIVKGIVDDQTNKLLEGVRLSEPGKYRPGIDASSRYSMAAGGYINSMTIASNGGTAWQHSNGLWVYIVDAKGRLVPDYTPKSAKSVMQPLLPLQQSGDGFKWTVK